MRVVSEMYECVNYYYENVANRYEWSGGVAFYRSLIHCWFNTFWFSFSNMQEIGAHECHCLSITDPSSHVNQTHPSSI